MTRKVLILIAVVCVPVALALASQALAAPTGAPELPRDSVKLAVDAGSAPSGSPAPSGSQAPRPSGSPESPAPSGRPSSAAATPAPPRPAPGTDGQDAPRHINPDPHRIPAPGDDDVEDDIDDVDGDD